MPSSLEKKSTRTLYLDFLRFLASYMVVLIHVSAQNWENVDIRSWERFVFTAYNLTASWAVSAFVMLTGILFLDPDRPVDTRKLYTKYIFRLITVFCFWSALHALDNLRWGISFRDLVGQFLQGHFHMWYIFLALGCYMLVPVFRKITQDKKVMEYFLIFCFVWNMLIPSTLSFLDYFKPPFTMTLSSAIASWRGLCNLSISSIYVFYFVYGLYLHKYGLPAFTRKPLHFLALAGYLGRLYFTVWYSRTTGSGDVPFDFCVMDLMVGTEVFLVIRDLFSRWTPPEAFRRLLGTVAACNLGIYMAHVMVMYKLQSWLGFTTLSYNPILSIPINTALTMAIALGITLILRKIPVLKHYIV